MKSSNPLKLKLIRFPTSALQPFASTLALQERLVQCKLLDRQNEPDYLIAVQHCPVITLGRRSHTESIEEKNVPIIKCNRGGQVTYHGPGQLTFYPILDLHRQPHLSLEWYVEQLASVMKDTIEQLFSIQNSFYDKCPERVGVWLTPTEKVGFIGIQAQRWIISHGFSLNVLSSSLDGFKNINPCGLGGKNIKISSCSHHFKDEPLLKETEDFIVKSFINKFTFSLQEQD